MRKFCMLLGMAVAQWAAAAGAAETGIEQSVYPGAVALGQNAQGAWGYKSFPELLPLYIFKGEPAGRSLCDRDCTAVWPIIQAQPDDAPVGQWTIVKREDGRLQWAYKGSPVYTYFEDRPNEPKGAGKHMDWYLDEDADAYLQSVGVEVAPVAASKRDGKAKQIQVSSELLKP